MLNAQQAAFSLSQRVVQIAVNSDFEDLRTEMVKDMVMKDLAGDVSSPAAIRLAVAIGVIVNLSAAIETMADDIAGKPPRPAR